MKKSGETMAELRCPKCGKTFKVDDDSYADILNQVRTHEFNDEVEKQVAAALEKADSKNELELEKAKRAIFDAPNLKKAFLIGETRHKLAENEDSKKYILEDTLESAVKDAKAAAEKVENSIVLLSPGAASFDMFKDFYARGDQFQKIIKEF
jgi:uncharacterized C2H2 Zn-finger protein